MTTGDLNRKGHGEKQSRNEEAAIAALLSEPTLDRAAQRCGIGAKTLWRWLRQPEFQARHREARRLVFEQAILRLQYIAGEAVDALHKSLECPFPAVQVRAALGILDQAVKASELYEMQDRLTKLEQRVGTNPEKTT
jgi:hypothetical protein